MIDAQRGYWDGVAGSARFTHPLDVTLLSRYVEPGDPVLDLGCGYGRVLGELERAGFSRLTGADSSPGMLARARALVPRASLVLAEQYPMPLPDRSFQCVVLFAVLSCQPTDAAQRSIVAEAWRLLRPGGIVYVSDFPLQPDGARRERYERFRDKYGVFGAFETEDGAVMRHLDPAWFDRLMTRFDEQARQTIAVRTMNGNEAIGLQYLGRRRSAESDRLPA
jgi:SAM-dependent methyltransferase